MQFILLFIALVQAAGLLSTSSSVAAELRGCTDPGTRAAVKTAVQERLGSFGLPRDADVLGLLSQLREARSDQANAIAAVFGRKSGLPASAFRLCEVADVGFDEPLFVTVLFVDPANNQPGGLVFNFGVPGAMAAFGDRMPSVQP